jgi:hypothetical protein
MMLRGVGCRRLWLWSACAALGARVYAQASMQS